MSRVHRIHSIFSASAVLLLLLTSSCSALSTPSKQAIPSSSHVASSTAAILNVNARSVSPPLIALTREVLGEENVHVTSTAEEARSAAQRVVERGHSLVIPMGGDGTLSGWIDRLVEEVMRRDAIHGGVGTVEDAFGRLPVIGYVPRGTGNGLGHVMRMFVDMIL